MSAREAALLTLVAMERQKAWSNGHLKKVIQEEHLDKRDAALATRLCFGVVQNKLLLDHYIQQFSTMKLQKMESKVRNSLRLGLYQMLFLTKIPVTAAVNESVELTKKHCKNPRAGGLVNGILRNLARNINELPALDRSSQTAYLSLLYSHPQWLVETWAKELDGEELETLLRWDNSEPPVTVQVNTCRFETPKVVLALEREGVNVLPHPWLPDCLVLTDTGDLTQRTAWQEGMFYPQDPAARLGLQSITTQVLDGKKPRKGWEERFDAVLADVPCSGLGVIRKKPEIRYKDPAELTDLPQIQGDILDNVSRYVKPGGVLLYSTCTLLQAENEDVVTAFLAQHPEYQLESFPLPGPLGEVAAGQCTLWPQRLQTDGFFLAKLRKEEAK